jgi:undecaprenyl diphosphate synthase
MQHLAIIPDGNRRWALKNKLKSYFGHKTGQESVRSAMKVCLENNIQYLSIYTFSLENFKRSDEEKEYLFELLSKGLADELPHLLEHGIRISFVGDKSFFPSSLQQVIYELESKTKHLDKLRVNLLFCYGAQQEIVHAVKSLSEKVKRGELDPATIDEKVISRELWTAGTPDPDLIIRTGGALRLSNFLLFQAAYSEFMFIDCFWPEMTHAKLQACIDEFRSVKRNFGQ